jgi:hypothetical protein
MAARKKQLQTLIGNGVILRLTEVIFVLTLQLTQCEKHLLLAKKRAVAAQTIDGFVAGNSREPCGRLAWNPCARPLLQRGDQRIL